MAKKFDKAEAMRGTVKEGIQSEMKEISPVEPIEESAEENKAPEVKEKRSVGRPKKVVEDGPRTELTRTLLTKEQKIKLKMICIKRGLSENDYLYPLVIKAIDKDYAALD